MLISVWTNDDADADADAEDDEYSLLLSSQVMQCDALLRHVDQCAPGMKLA
jgi:hypothetical protein